MTFIVASFFFDISFIAYYSKISFANAGAKSAKSPYGELHNDADEYFGPMKRLEEIVNEISEEVREGGREAEGSSPHTEVNLFNASYPPTELKCHHQTEILFLYCRMPKINVQLVRRNFNGHLCFSTYRFLYILKKRLGFIHRLLLGMCRLRTAIPIPILTLNLPFPDQALWQLLPLVELCRMLLSLDRRRLLLQENLAEIHLQIIPPLRQTHLILHLILDPIPSLNVSIIPVSVPLLQLRHPNQRKPDSVLHLHHRQHRFILRCIQSRAPEVAPVRTIRG